VARRFGVQTPVMGRVHDGIDDRLSTWISQQHLFFVATAPTEGGHVNVSPKGFAGSFAVLGPREIAYLDYTGSGIETVAHLAENGRIVVMFCAFDGPPRIVRLHGHGRAVFPADDGFESMLARFDGEPRRGLRSIIHAQLDRVSDSCGFGVPFMSYEGERDTMPRWVDGKSDDDLARYRTQKNSTSIDGLPGVPAG
jgi:hypothetical protein